MAAPSSSLSGTGKFDAVALAAFEASLCLAPNHPPITPVSSPEDNRKYRVITLANGLTALLVSDPETDKSAASLDVNVGSFAEPSDCLGLAHFLEHMLFMGTEKYPDENEYSLAINNYGGSQNAYTTREHTNYIFDVTKDHLREVLDKFANFFVAPLCKKDAVDRELTAVNNEHQKNLTNDYWRIAQLSESSLNPDHPISRFSTGDFVTLRDQPAAAGIDIRERLMEFYRTHYSANLMRLCVVGAEDLDVLAEWVTESFSAVPNIGVARPDLTSIPLALPVHMATLTKIVPVKNYRSLEVEWTFPPTHQHYLADPAKLLVHCIAHEAEGSLAYHLKSLGYVNNLTGNQLEQNSSYAIGSIEMELTESGLEHVDEIVELVFSYTHMLRDSLTTHAAVWRDEIWSEVKAVDQMAFRFSEKIDPVWFAESQAARLSSIPAIHVLSGGCCEKYDAEVLGQMAAVYADVRSARVRVIAPEYKTLEGLQKEHWYGTEHTSAPLSPSLLARCEKPPQVPEYHLPKSNPFVATDFALKNAKRSDADKKAGVMNEMPKRFQCCGVGASAGAPPAEVFFVPDRSFELPKVNVQMLIGNPLSNASPAAVSMGSLWRDLAEDALSELHHLASEAGVDVDYNPCNHGLSLTVRGFSHKAQALLESLLPQLRAVRATERPEQFKRLKEAMHRRLSGFSKEAPLMHCRHDAQQLKLDQHWTVDEQLVGFEAITPIALDRFIEAWFREGRLTVLVNGNMLESEATALTHVVQAAFPLEPLLSSQTYANRCIDLPSTHSYLRQLPNRNPADTNSACVNMYQIPTSADLAIEANMLVISHILGDALFDQLRTKETLGYMVYGQHSFTAGVMHYTVSVVSSDAAPTYLNHRIEAFLRWFRDVQLGALIAETPDFLAKNKQAVVLQITERDKNLRDEGSRIWHEIEKSRYEWDRDERVAKEVEKVTLEGVNAFFDRYLLAESTSSVQSQRKKFSFQYAAHTHPIPEQLERETAESVASGNVKLTLKNAAVAAAPVADGATPAAAAAEVYLPPVPVDPRPLKYVSDLVEFKRSQAMHPARP